MGRRLLGVLVGCVISCASAVAQDKADVARELFARLDMTRPEMREVAALADGGDVEGALDLWRDGVVTRLREHDFGEYGWHGYVIHPRPGGAADHLAGKTSREEYLTSGLVGFVDIYGMAGAPGTIGKIDWAVDISGPVDWGTPELAALDKGAKLLKADYPNFEFAKALVGKYWQTDDEVHLLKAFEIMSDFARNNRREFWADYHAKGIGDTEVREIYRTDWRLNTNGLGMGWRAKNFIKIMAGIAKSLSADKPDDWESILGPLNGEPTREELDRVPSAQLAEIAISLVEDHSGKLLWFCLGSGAVPNQRSEGLKALVFMSVIFPNFKKTPQLVEYINRGYEDMLTGNFLPDGGSLEQSFNYNGQDKEGLEELVRFFGDEPPSYAQLALAKVRARRAVDDGLQTPLGGLPKVGNHHDILGKDVWSSDEAAERYWASDAIHGRESVRPREYASKAYRYSGFFAMRGGWEMDDPYLFFMAGRPQRGHSMRDNNAIQMTAFGRQLVVCGGSPTYGNFRNEDARGADFYLSEASSLKCNTVIVDGNSQSKDGPKVARGYETPVDSRWHTSDRYDVVDGLYDLGYGKFEDGRDVEIDKSVAHYRQVIFVKAAGLWVVLDRMDSSGDAEHEYTQLWNFLPRVEHANWQSTIAGFGDDEFSLDAEAKVLRTVDPDGPNVEFRHFGPERVTYTKYHG
ncbi:MAG TPA: heparinase II/III family protein, partial [Armatimonadota bacterium]|nr:heparinase II/III family protein [Armatimonadota bacterium]